MRAKTIINSYISEIFQQHQFNKIFVYGSDKLELEKLIIKLTSSPIIGGDVEFYNTLLGCYYTNNEINYEKYQLIINKFEFNKKLDDIEYISLCLIYKQYEKYFLKNNIHFTRLKQNIVNKKQVLIEQTRNNLIKNKININEFYCEPLKEFIERVTENDLLIIENMPKGFEKLNINFPRNCVIVSHNDEIILNKNYKSIKSENCNIYSSLLLDNHFLKPSPSNRSSINIKVLNTGDINEIVIKEMDYQNFHALRKRYLSKRIHHLGIPKVCYGVFDDKNNFIGAFGLTNDYRNAIPTRVEGPSIYLLSDFVVNSNTKHLSKLILYIVLSKEVKILCERLLNKGTKTVVTNVFCKGMSSMKYRNLFCIAERKQEKNLNYNITYYANFGNWTIKEGLELWKRKLLK